MSTPKKKVTPTKKAKNTSIVKFVQIVRDFAPKFTETSFNDTITFGEDNKLPYLLTDLYGSVSLHKGIIQKKQNMIKAKGLYIDEDEANFQKTLDWFENVNPSETFEDLWNKIVADYTIYGGSYLQVIWSRDGKNVNSLYHMPFETMRSGKANGDGVVNEYFYNSDRTAYGKYTKGTTSAKLESFPSFGSEDKSVPQIYYIKNYDPSSFYYGLPDYSSAITDLDTFRSISEFHNSNIHNGMQPSYIIMMPGPVPSQEKQDHIFDAIKTKHKGIDSAGKPLLFFLDNADKPTIETVDASDIDKMYKELHTTTQSNIITAHQIPRVLANVATEGSLGSGKEYIEAEVIFNKTYVQPTQDFLLKKVNVLFDINELAELKIEPIEAEEETVTVDQKLEIDRFIINNFKVKDISYFEERYGVELEGFNVETDVQFQELNNQLELATIKDRYDINLKINNE